MMNNKNMLDWDPAQAIGVIFNTPETPEGEEPVIVTQAHINTFFDEIKASAAKAGLHMDMWGLKADFEKALHKDYGKRKWYEGINAMRIVLTNGPGHIIRKEIIKEHVAPEFQP